MRGGRSTVGAVKARTLSAIVAAVAGVAAAPAPAPAALRNAAPPPRVELPGAVSIASAGADRSTWIVGAKPRAAAARIARAHGAGHIAGGAWVVARGKATALAGALRARGLLDYAEPNRISRNAQAPAADPLTPLSPWRVRVVGNAVPPVVTPAGPLVALVDSQLDPTTPEIATSPNIQTTGGQPLTDFHGTSTASVVAAAANGVGMLGLWPGARALNVSLPQTILCSDSARMIAEATKRGAAVINMSYGSQSRCTAEADAIQRAIKQGAVPVAASGNEFDQGNPLEFPASLPHVLTVAALDDNTDDPAFFSSESAAVDLSAPGVNVLAAVPRSTNKNFDPDQDGDGFAFVAGTSFSAPMVSAAVAWVRAARPDLTPGQVADVIRFGTRDIGKPGYENATGYGILSLEGALAKTAPRDDPLEPNDDIRLVDGREFRTPAAPIFTGRKDTLRAAADVAEDPADVYRVKVEPRHRARIKLAPSVGDPDLYVFDSHARSVFTSRHLAGSSKKGEGRTDTVTVRNRGHKTTTFYAVVGFTRTKTLRLLNASYALKVAQP
jgi:hypothetical protein